MERHTKGLYCIFWASACMSHACLRCVVTFPHALYVVALQSHIYRTHAHTPCLLLHSMAGATSLTSQVNLHHLEYNLCLLDLRLRGLRVFSKGTNHRCAYLPLHSQYLQLLTTANYHPPLTSTCRSPPPSTHKYQNKKPPHRHKKMKPQQHLYHLYHQPTRPLANAFPYQIYGFRPLRGAMQPD